MGAIPKFHRTTTGVSEKVLGCRPLLLIIRPLQATVFFLESGNAPSHSSPLEAPTSCHDRVPIRPFLINDKSFKHVSEDYSGVSYRNRHMALRKSTPPWSLPVEIWRVLLAPRRFREPKNLGIGASVHIPACPTFQSRIRGGSCYHSCAATGSQVMEQVMGFPFA